MELVGAHGGFRRGYDGFQDIELRVNDQLADQYIVHEPSQYIHNLTPEEVKYYTLTSNQKQFVAFFLKTIDKFDDTQNDRMNTLIKLNKLAQNIKTNGKSDKRLSAEYKIICKKNPIIKRYFSYHKRVYCEINKLDPSELSKQQEKYILRDFLKTGFSQLTENSLEYLKASEHQENLELFRPILSLIESQSMSMEELYEQLETISQDIGKINKEEKTKSKKYADKQFEKLMEKYHLLKILYDRNKQLYPNLKKERYLKKFVKSDIEMYLSFREALLKERKNRSMGANASRVVLPIGDIHTNDIDFKGHPAGLDVLEMLKMIPQIVGSERGYSPYHNCSDFVQAFGYAGAPKDYKYIFNRYGLGIASTPQVVANGAMQYANIIYDIHTAPSKHRVGFFHRQYLAQEQKAAKAVKKFQALEEKIKMQDKIVNKIIENKEDNEDDIDLAIYNGVMADKRLMKKYLNKITIKQKMIELYKDVYSSKDFKTKNEGVDKDYRKRKELYQRAYDTLLKEAIYEYCDQRYHNNIAEDRARLESDIISKTGLFEQISRKDPNPLSNSAIKEKMREHYHLFYRGKYLGKNKRVESDFREKKELYIRACHSIIYEHASDSENLADPDYVSMKNERILLPILKKYSFREIGLLVAMRALGSTVKTPYNVIDPWHEVKAINETVKLYIQSQFGKEYSTGKFASNLVRYLLVGSVGIAQGLFIAPRRYLSNRKWHNTSKASLAKSSEDSQRLDLRFAYKTGKITTDDMIKMRMKEIFIQKNPPQKEKLSANKMHELIEFSFLNQDALYLNAKKSVAISDEMEQERAATQTHLLHHREKEKTLFSKESVSGNLIEIKNRSLNICFKEFTDALNNGRIPVFSKNTNRRMLTKINHIENIITRADIEFEGIFKPNIKDKFDQFYRAEMALKGENSTDKSSWRYDPVRHKDVIPKRIKYSTSPEEIRIFLKKRVKLHQDGEDYDFLFKPEEIDAMKDETLLAAIKYLTMPTYIDRLKTFEKDILQQMLSDPTITTINFDDNNMQSFKQFLKDHRMDDDIVDLLDKKHALKDFLIRLKHTECSAKSTREVVKKYGNTELVKEIGSENGKRATSLTHHFQSSSPITLSIKEESNKEEEPNDIRNRSSVHHT